MPLPISTTASTAISTALHLKNWVIGSVRLSLKHRISDDAEHQHGRERAGEDGRAIPLVPQRRVEQDRLERLAIDDQESEAEQEPGRAARQGALHLLGDIAPPFVGLRLAVHPHADRQQHQRRDQRPEAFGDLAARAADSDRISGDDPRAGPGGERRDPAAVDVAQRLGAVGAAEESDHRDHYQQGFEAFAEQDGERAEEGGDAAFGLGGERGLSIVEQRLGVGEAAAELRRRLTADDRLAEAGHRLLDPAHQRPVAGRQHRLDRLEAVEVCGQRETVGFRAVAGRISGEAFAQALAGELERRVAALAAADRLRIGAQVGDDRCRPLGADLRLQIGGGQSDQRREVGDQRADGGVAFPDALTGRGVAVGERAAVESERPAVFLGKRREALHRGALEALRDHLVQAEHAAVAGAVAVGEGDRRRVELGEGGRRPFALGAMARRAIPGVERRAASDVGRLGRRQGHRISGEQAGSERLGALCDVGRRGLGGDSSLEGL